MKESGYSETKQHASTLRDNRNGYASIGGEETVDRLAELTAEYSKSINSHNFTLLGGYSYQENEYLSVPDVVKVNFFFLSIYMGYSRTVFWHIFPTHYTCFDA